MIIIIDGYNVMKHHDPDRRISEQERSQFIRLMGRYAGRKRHALIVVFDGGDAAWPYKETIAGIKVVYAGFKKTADDVIMRYIKDYANKDLLLVSSDNELGRCADRHDVVSIGSEEFYYLVSEADSQSSSSIIDEPEIAVDQEVESLDELMQEASRQVPLKSEDQQLNRVIDTGRGRLSKNDRKLLNLLKKL